MDSLVIYLEFYGVIPWGNQNDANISMTGNSVKTIMKPCNQRILLVLEMCGRDFFIP